MNREHRNLLLDGQLVLISPYDPSAGFNVGNAMHRNKLIYGLADASLVVSSDLDKGGTWAGAIEQLDKLKFVPVYVRSTGMSTAGLSALMSKGAIPWPNPQDEGAFEGVFDVTMPTPMRLPQSSDAVFPAGGLFEIAPRVQEMPPAFEAQSQLECLPASAPADEPVKLSPEQAPPAALAADVITEVATALATRGSTPAEVLFAAVRETIRLLLQGPMKDVEVAALLNVSNAQAKAWLERLVDEGVIEKQKKPVRYSIKASSLFE